MINRYSYLVAPRSLRDVKFKEVHTDIDIIVSLSALSKDKVLYRWRSPLENFMSKLFSSKNFKSLLFGNKKDATKKSK